MTAGQPHGVVRVRLMGEPAALDVLAEIIAAHPAVQVIERGAHYPNRRDPGERAYLTVRVDMKEAPHARSV